MFDIGWSELLVVGMVALIVVGPKELPGMMRKIGAFIKKVKQMAGSFQRQFEEAMDESEISELKDSVNELKKDLSPGAMMEDLGLEEEMDDFDLDKWNEQILEDEKKRLANPIRSHEEMHGTDGSAAGHETAGADKDGHALKPVNGNEPLSEGASDAMPEPISETISEVADASSKGKQI